MDQEKAKDQAHVLDFHVDRSMRYHQRMRGHYDTWNRAVLFVAILFGAGSPFAEVPAYLGTAAAVIVAFNLVWEPSHRARDHESLFQRFSELTALIRSSEPTDENLRSWRKQREDIQRSERPLFCALEADCHNEACRALGQTQELVKITWWQRRTMYWIRHDKVPFDEISNAQKA